jgi:hypothetical protein
MTLPTFRSFAASAAVSAALASSAFAQTVNVPGGLIGNISGPNVGIGTNTPGYRLDVSGTFHAADSATLGDGHWYNECMDYTALSTYGGTVVRGNSINVGKLTIGSWTQSAPDWGLWVGGNSVFGGNVGIGTISPTERLSVYGDSGVRISRQSNQDQFIMLLGGDGGGMAELWTTYNLRIRGAGSGAYGNVVFCTGASTETMRIASSGNVGIGTTNPTNKLEVNGTIRTKEVIVETTGWSDYVFAPDYRLAPLSEVKAHIAAAGHLPGIPSAAEVAAKGVSVGDMQVKLLAKVEELTLHLIALEEENAALKARVSSLETASAEVSP